MDILEQLQNSRVKKTELSRGEIRWACRRGMLELDILLGDYFDAHFDELTSTDKKIFETLVALPDQLLYEYFTGKISPDDPGIARVFKKICDAAGR